MGKAGLVPLLYGVACFVFNYLGYLIPIVPNLGTLGSWMFNPLGMGLSSTLANVLVQNFSSGWFGDLTGGVTWFVGAAFGFLWTFGLIFLGIKLLTRKSSSRPKIMKPY